MIPEAGEALIASKLQLALEYHDDTVAERQLQDVLAIFDYALVLGQLSAREYGERRRIVELTRQRRAYR